MKFFPTSKFELVDVKKVEVVELPINIIPADVLNITLADGESYLSGGQLLFIREEEHTTATYPAIPDNTPCFPYADLANIYYLYSAIVELKTKFDDGLDPSADTFNKFPDVHTMYYHDTATSPTPATNSLSVDDSLQNPASISINENTGQIEVGIQIGTQVNGINYPGVCEYLVIVFQQAATVGNLSVYKSDNNASWEPVNKAGSQFNNTFWINAEYYNANYRTLGYPFKMIHLATPVKTNYLKVLIPTNSNTRQIRAIMAYTTYPLFVLSKDLLNAEYQYPYGTSRDASPYNYQIESGDYFRLAGFYVNPQTLVGTAGAIELDKFQVYASTKYVGHGSAGNVKSFAIQDGVPGSIGAAQTEIIRNNHASNSAVSFNVRVLIEPHRVTSQAVSAGVTSFQLKSANLLRNATGILNSTLTGLSTSANTSVTTTGAALTTYTAGALTLPGQYTINATTGVVTTVTVTAGTETISFYYNDEGSMITQVSVDGTTWKTCWDTAGATKTETITPTGTSVYYVRANLTAYSDNLLRIAKTLEIMTYKNQVSIALDV